MPRGESLESRDEEPALSQEVPHDRYTDHTFYQVMSPGKEQEEWRAIGTEANIWHKMC